MRDDGVRKFLELDKEVKFKVVSGSRLRSETKNFVNDENFVQYMLSLLDGKIGKKVRLKNQ